MFAFVGYLHTVFQNGYTILYFHQHMRVPVAPHFCQWLLFSVFRNSYDYSNRYAVVSCGSNFCFPTSNYVEHLFMFLFAIHISLVFKSFCHIQKIRLHPYVISYIKINSKWITWIFSCSSTICWKAIVFPLGFLGTSVENKLTLYIGLFLHSLVFHWFTCLFTNNSSGLI